MTSSALIRPLALRPGDCIGLAAPASPFQVEALHEGIAVLEGLGFHVRYTQRIFARYRYLAGSDAERAAELHALFADPHIKAIFCCRGGYGSQRLLPYLDAALIAANPKIFVGYSDLTSLLCYLYNQCRLMTLHGPVVTGDLRSSLNADALRQLQGMLMGDKAAMQPPASCLTEISVLRPGEAAGRLLGGCLSVFVCTIGTSYQPSTRGAILFLEDRGERLYAIDRMLTRLKLAGVLEGVRGIVFGNMQRVDADRHLPYGIPEVILEVLGDLPIPLLYGFPAGHCLHPLTLPFGALVAIRNGTLVFQETPVQNRHVGNTAT